MRITQRTVRKALKITSLTVLCLVLALLFWGAVIEPRIIDHQHVVAVIPNLPQWCKGRRIALIADFQVGMWLNNEGTTRRIVRELVDDRPAAVLIAGDFVYHPTEEDSLAEAITEFDAEEEKETSALIADVVDLLRPLTEARIPVYAVLGNHDYAMGSDSSLKLSWVAEELATALEDEGIEVLRNEVTTLRTAGVERTDRQPPLYLVGIGPYYAGEDDVKQALSDLPTDAARIILMHNPQSFADVPEGQGPLCLAAHTHGGQIRIPFLPSSSWLGIVKEGEVHADGWIRDVGQGNNRLYVNRGIGFSGVPLRINCPPEITYITLADSDTGPARRRKGS